jgi:molecular chaperone GrpE
MMSHKHKHPHETPDAKEAAAESKHSPGIASEEIQAAETNPPLDFEGWLRQKEELEKASAAANDRALRCQAELDNYRKRASRDLQDQLRYAELPLMRDLLPVLDNIQRAIEAAEKSSEGGGLLDGVKLVAQQLQDVLARHHCVKIEALHAPFDPHSHQAILQQPSREHPANTVILVTQEGYRLHDRVVRPSQVIVSTNSNE